MFTPQLVILSPQLVIHTPQKVMFTPQLVILWFQNRVGEWSFRYGKGLKVFKRIKQQQEGKTPQKVIVRLGFGVCCCFYPLERAKFF